MRPAALVAAGCLVLVLGFQLWITPSNPPGFHHDEAAFALNASTVAHDLRGQDGALLPVFFPSYGDYKSTVFVYALAPVMWILGPSDAAARATATAFVLAALALVGLIVWRRTGRRTVTVAAVVLAGLTPWLFQLGRVAYDWSAFPFATGAVLLAADVWSRGRMRLAARAGVLGLALGLMTYTYSAGRLLGPLLAVALLVFAGSRPFRDIAAAWAAYAVALIPFGAYALRHPNGLTARYHETTFVTAGMSKPAIVGHAAWNYLQDVSPLHWIIAGDRKPYASAGRLGRRAACCHRCARPRWGGGRPAGAPTRPVVVVRRLRAAARPGPRGPDARPA